MYHVNAIKDIKPQIIRHNMEFMNEKQTNEPKATKTSCALRCISFQALIVGTKSSFILMVGTFNK